MEGRECPPPYIFGDVGPAPVVVENSRGDTPKTPTPALLEWRWKTAVAVNVHNKHRLCAQWKIVVTDHVHQERWKLVLLCTHPSSKLGPASTVLRMGDWLPVVESHNNCLPPYCLPLYSHTNPFHFKQWLPHRVTLQGTRLRRMSSALLFV